MTQQVCIVCEIPFIEGKGFIGKHKFPCANAAHGWAFTKDKDERPKIVRLISRWRNKIFRDAIKLNPEMIQKK